MEQNYGFLKGKEIEDAIKKSFNCGEGMAWINDHCECIILNLCGQYILMADTSRTKMDSEEKIITKKMLIAS